MSKQEQYISGLCGIYEVKTHDSSYVGQSKNLAFRFGQHLRVLNNNTGHNPKLQEFVDKHGIQELSFHILELCTPIELKEREVYWIKKRGANSLNRINKQDKPRTQVSVHRDTKEKLQSLGYQSINDAILSLFP